MDEAQRKRRCVNSNQETQSLAHNDYTVGWLCALSVELATARAMLDQEHPDLPSHNHDQNTYTLGSMGKHNVVLACLPMGVSGAVTMANAAHWMFSTFPSIKLCLLVGTGQGIPTKVKLGDVVVSVPCAQTPGVIKWDQGKAKDGVFERVGSLNKPPTTLLTAVTKLSTSYMMGRSRLAHHLEQLRINWPTMDAACARPTTVDDQHGDNAVTVHHGLIASGSQVVEDAQLRSTVDQRLGGNVLCIETEAAGLMDCFPCLVIRGICDYADSNKDKKWQEHAAAVAAAYAKDLLATVQSSHVDKEPRLIHLLNSGQWQLVLGSSTSSTLKQMIVLDTRIQDLNAHTPAAISHAQKTETARDMRKQLIQSFEFPTMNSRAAQIGDRCDDVFANIFSTLECEDGEAESGRSTSSTGS